MLYVHIKHEPWRNLMAANWGDHWWSQNRVRHAWEESDDGSSSGCFHCFTRWLLFLDVIAVNVHSTHDMCIMYQVAMGPLKSCLKSSHGLSLVSITSQWVAYTSFSFKSIWIFLFSFHKTCCLESQYDSHVFLDWCLIIDLFPWCDFYSFTLHSYHSSNYLLEYSTKLEIDPFVSVWW